MGHRIKPSPCPHCGNVNDGATATRGEDVLPKPGDIAVCAYCAEFAAYDEQLELKKMSEETLKFIRENIPDLYNEIYRAQRAVIALNLKSPKNK